MEAVFVQLNTRCNARCVNCPHPFTYAKQPHHSMSDETWDTLLSSLTSFTGQVGLYLHFEPLTEPTLFDKMRDVHSRTRGYVVISTNGSLLDEEKAERLLAASPRLVVFNVNSGDKEQYERMTGLPFERTIANVRRFIDMGGPVQINCPVMPETDVGSLLRLFPDVPVNTEYWANSRGGLLPLSASGHGSRFRLASRCVQPEVNRCVLWDGSTIICCMDWLHESRCNSYAQAIEDFTHNDYSRYRMCRYCASEHGWAVPCSSST